MADLKKKLLIQEKQRELFQEGLANKRKEEREQFYKAKYCKELYNEMRKRKVPVPHVWEKL